MSLGFDIVQHVFACMLIIFRKALSCVPVIGACVRLLVESFYRLLLAFAGVFAPLGGFALSLAIKAMKAQSPSVDRPITLGEFDGLNTQE